MTPWFDGGCGSCERTSYVANELNLTALNPCVLLSTFIIFGQVHKWIGAQVEGKY